MADINMEERVLDDALIAKIFGFAADLVEIFGFNLVSDEDNEYRGGAIALYDPELGLHSSRIIGGVGQLKVSTTTIKQRAEKAGHLMHNWDQIVSGPSHTYYSAGIQLENGCYLSFYGFPQVWGRVFCLVVAEELGLVEPPRRNQILKKSENPLETRVFFRETKDVVAAAHM